VISEVPSGSIAARQGFRAGDVIRSANREIIETVADLEAVLEEARSRRWSFILDRGGRTVTYRLVY
jgi:S1-C subfamily serine protease